MYAKFMLDYRALSQPLNDGTAKLQRFETKQMRPIFMGHTRMAPMGSMQRFSAIPSCQVNVVKGLEDVSELNNQ